MTPAQLESFLSQYNGGNRICTITTKTPTKMLKKSRVDGRPNPFLDHNGESTVDHLQERLVNFGADYEKRVNRVWQREMTPDADGFVPYFEASALWRGKGERVNRYIARHTETGQVYLVYLQATRTGRNVSLRQEAWIDRNTGKLMQLADFQEFMPAVSPSKKQGVADGLIQEETCPRTIKIENVIQIRSIDFERGNYQTLEVTHTPGQRSV